MIRRLSLAILLLLIIPLAALADGMVVAHFSPQLRETHQLAVINLTETTADVSMFIAIEGIPAGQEITYILPFWYAPEGFTLAEDDAGTFRDAVVAPAHQKVSHMQALPQHIGVAAILDKAKFTCLGLSRGIDRCHGVLCANTQHRLAQMVVVIILD